jgi:hypothetical protein
MTQSAGLPKGYSIAIDTRAWQPEWEARLAVTARVNLLLVGESDALLAAMHSTLRSPITSWRPDDPWPALPEAGTFILREVNRLDLAGQLRLSGWLDRTTGSVQTISTAATSLLPLVEAGGFLESLYYRLNIVCIDTRDIPSRLGLARPSPRRAERSTRVPRSGHSGGGASERRENFPTPSK